MISSLCTLLLVSIPSAEPNGQVTIGGQEYRKLETRQATLDRMLGLLVPEAAEWGDWFVASPFPFDAETGLDGVQPPEGELERMVHGGPGPDLAAVYAGKKGTEVTWQPLADATNRRVLLLGFEDPELNDWATAFLYTTLVVDEAKEVEVPFGSDDGVRVWLNGEVVYSLERMRGMTAGEDRLMFDLLPGTNHALFEVYQGTGGWEFQIETRPALPATFDAQLFYQLDRDFPPSREREHYRVMSYPVPDDVVLEVGGLDFLGDGRPVVSTRRGDIWIVNDAYAEPPVGAGFQLFASGLHEALGVGVRNDPDGEAVYSVQRGELTRLLDTDGDDVAELYETFSDGWGVSGNYHEFAFGPEFDDEGNAWVTLNVGFCGSLGKAIVPWRGWALKITPAGEVLPVCDGLRSPNGIGRFDGEMFYLDNQGDYVATNRLSHLAQDSWHGHPASLRWREGLAPDERPPRQPAAVWFPYQKMGQSVADLALDTTAGRFGPFEDQFFAGGQTHATVFRIFLEKVEGHYQGACFPFLTGLASGVNRVAFAPDGSMLVGQTDRGWGSVGRRRYGLERIVYTGEVPFEIRAMRAVAGGFELEFTRPADAASAADPGSYRLSSYTYAYHADYGAPETDAQDLSIERVDVTPGGERATLHVAPLRAGYVHELHAEGVRDPAGQALVHDEAYYTLERVPGQTDGQAADLPHVLFLTHSAGFEHDVVRRPRPEIYSVAEERFVEAARDRWRVTPTRDLAQLSRESLARYDAVVFFTTGDLPLPEGGLAQLLAWVRSGGAFVGVHSATDTFLSSPEYLELIGGAFAGHPWNELATLRIVDGDHPATAPLGSAGDTFQIADEIYEFRAPVGGPHRILLRLAGTESDPELTRAARPEPALAWCRDYGSGRVFYTALGHRPEVWRDERFLAHLLGGLSWSVGSPTDQRVAPLAPQLDDP